MGQKKGSMGRFLKKSGRGQNIFFSICTLENNRFSVVHVNFQTISSICPEISGILLKCSIFGVNMDSKQIKFIKWKTKAKWDPPYTFWPVITHYIIVKTISSAFQRYKLFIHSYHGSPTMFQNKRLGMSEIWAFPNTFPLWKISSKWVKWPLFHAQVDMNNYFWRCFIEIEVTYH